MRRAPAIALTGGRAHADCAMEFAGSPVGLHKTPHVVGAVQTTGFDSIPASFPGINERKLMSSRPPRH